MVHVVEIDAHAEHEDVALVRVPAPGKRIHDYVTRSSQSVLSVLAGIQLGWSLVFYSIGRRVYSGLVLLFDNVKYSFDVGSRRMTNFVWPPGR